MQGSELNTLQTKAEESGITCFTGSHYLSLKSVLDDKLNDSDYKSVENKNKSKNKNKKKEDSIDKS